MAKAVRDLLEAFYNVLYKMLFEAVALFMGERAREGRMEARGGERGEKERKMRAGNKLLCIWKHHPGMSLMGTLSFHPPRPAPTPAHPPLEKL